MRRYGCLLVALAVLLSSFGGCYFACTRMSDAPTVRFGGHRRGPADIVVAICLVVGGLAAFAVYGEWPSKKRARKTDTHQR
jgi:hypothetical protein